MLGERGYCKFGGDTCIGLEDIARKREGGARNSPPSGARVKAWTHYAYQVRNLGRVCPILRYCVVWGNVQLIGITRTEPH